MKKDSLFYSAVIVLLFLAVRTEAQGDSLSLRFYLQGDGFTYILDGTSGTLTSKSTNIYCHVPDNLNIALFENATYDLSFTVDTISSTIRDLQIGRGISPAQNQYTIWVGGSEEYVFDSLPFVGNWKDGLKILGKVYNVLDSTTIYANGKQYSGASFQNDSLYLELSPANSSVSNSHVNTASELYIRWDAQMNSTVASFSSSDIPRTMEIDDLLGRIVSSISIPVEAESLPLPNSISPGCYFAHIGDQVTKFIVPPK